jgi:drug/metabolite transporter (DMT)-like permease
MLYLVGSIVFSSCLTLLFKVVERYRISNLQAIVFNYFTCVGTGLLFDGSFGQGGSVTGEEWFKWSVIMGLMFISTFNLIAYTVQKMGVAITSVANKLSLVIPFLFSIYLYSEQVTLFKIAGIVVALVAVVFTSMPSGGKEPSGQPFQPGLLLLPVVLFVASGMIDTLIKYVEVTHLNDSNKNTYLITAFGVAGTSGLLVLLVLLLSGKEKFDYRSIAAGVIIGVPNYLSIWCLVQVLKTYSGNSTAILPINNMGIVLFSTVVAWLLFKEHLSTTNRLGILLALGAIALIAYG